MSEFFSDCCQSLLVLLLASASAMFFTILGCRCEVPIFLDFPFLFADVVLEALVNDNFVVSSFVCDEDVDLETLDVHSHSSLARCFAMMHVVLSEGRSLML